MNPGPDVPVFFINCREGFVLNAERVPISPASPTLRRFAMSTVRPQAIDDPVWSKARTALAIDPGLNKARIAYRLLPVRASADDIELVMSLQMMNRD